MLYYILHKDKCKCWTGNIFGWIKLPLVIIRMRHCRAIMNRVRSSEHQVSTAQSTHKSIERSRMPTRKRPQRRWCKDCHLTCCHYRLQMFNLIQELTTINYSRVASRDYTRFYLTSPFTPIHIPIPIFIFVYLVVLPELYFIKYKIYIYINNFYAWDESKCIVKFVTSFS